MNKPHPYSKNLHLLENARVWKICTFVGPGGNGFLTEKGISSIFAPSLSTDQSERLKSKCRLTSLKSLIRDRQPDVTTAEPLRRRCSNPCVHTCACVILPPSIHPGPPRAPGAI